MNLRKIIREQLQSASPDQAAYLDLVNRKAALITNRVYDFTISQFSKYGIEIADKNKLKYDIDDAISQEIIVDIDDEVT